MDIILGVMIGTIQDIDFQANLNRVCDMANEIVPFSRALVFLWSGEKQRTDSALMRQVDISDPDLCWLPICLTSGPENTSVRYLFPAAHIVELMCCSTE